MEANVKWSSKMAFTGSTGSGFEVPLDTHPAFGGENDGFRPMELMAISLAGCTAMDVLSILQKKRMEVTAFEVKVHTEQAKEHPKVFTKANIEYIVVGHDISESAVVRAIELSATRYCPAQAMLAKAFPIRLTYQIYEGKSDDVPVLITSGEWL